MRKTHLGSITLDKLQPGKANCPLPGVAPELWVVDFGFLHDNLANEHYQEALQTYLHWAARLLCEGTNCLYEEDGESGMAPVFDGLTQIVDDFLREEDGRGRYLRFILRYVRADAYAHLCKYFASHPRKAALFALAKDYIGNNTPAGPRPPKFDKKDPVCMDWAGEAYGQLEDRLKSIE